MDAFYYQTIYQFVIRKSSQNNETTSTVATRLFLDILQTCRSNASRALAPGFDRSHDVKGSKTIGPSDGTE